MLKRVLNHPGFWKSVASLAIAFALVFTIIKWAIDGFSAAFFTERDPLRFFLGVILAGFVYGFFVSFGKFRNKLKNNQN
jgi:cytochrome c biogenesis protein CcdA